MLGERESHGESCSREPHSQHTSGAGTVKHRTKHLTFHSVQITHPHPLAWSLPVSGTNNCVTQPDLDWVLVTVTTLHHHHLCHIPNEKLISHISDQTCNFVSGREKALCSVLYCVLCTVTLNKGCCPSQQMLLVRADWLNTHSRSQLALQRKFQQ